MAKKFGIMLLTAALLTAMVAVASATVYYVTGNDVRVRSGPGTDYKILDHVSRGTKIDVRSTENGWARISRNGTTGYVSTKFISRTKPTSQVKPASTATETTNYANFVTANYYVIVNPTNSYVNMRWEASKSSPVKKIYYYGAQLRVLAENANWCQVMDESTNEVGFILKSLLLKVE